MIRVLDVVLSAFGLCLMSPVFVLLMIGGFSDTGSPIFFQTRLGRKQRPFTLYKFRTMPVGTPSLPTHDLGFNKLSSYGRLLRRTKLDELPQLWNVFRGDMSLVGPRPCLLSQADLVRLREKAGVFKVRPGITGLAQVRGIDMRLPSRLVAVEKQMISESSISNYFSLIFQTLIGRGQGDSVSQSNNDC